MNRFIQQTCVFVALVAVGVAARVGLQDVPNFAPVAALALFAGYYFSRRAVACAAPLLVMLVSDSWIDAGGYPLPLMLTVYGLLALPVLFGRPVRRRLAFDHGSTGLGAMCGCGRAARRIRPTRSTARRPASSRASRRRTRNWPSRTTRGNAR